MNEVTFLPNTTLPSLLPYWPTFPKLWTSRCHYFGCNLCLNEKKQQETEKSLNLYSDLRFKFHHLVHFQTTSSHRARRGCWNSMVGWGRHLNLGLNPFWTICFYTETKEQNSVHATDALSGKTQILSFYSKLGWGNGYFFRKRPILQLPSCVEWRRRASILFSLICKWVCTIQNN